MARPDAAVLIPYGYRSEWEERLVGFVEHHWATHFPEWEVYLSSGESSFNRSAARNSAAALSSAEILIFCDADTLFGSPYDIEKAVTALSEGRGAPWYGCEYYYMLCKQWTVDKINHVGRSKAGIPWEKSLTRPPGGISICRRADFEAIGGYDEAFEGWGYEDSAFCAVMTSLVGEKGLFGDVFHLWHPKSRSERQEQPQISANRRRFGAYEEAARKGPDAMNALLSRLRSERNAG